MSGETYGLLIIVGVIVFFAAWRFIAKKNNLLGHIFRILWNLAFSLWAMMAGFIPGGLGEFLYDWFLRLRIDIPEE